MPFGSSNCISYGTSLNNTIWVNWVSTSYTNTSTIVSGTASTTSGTSIISNQIWTNWVQNSMVVSSGNLLLNQQLVIHPPTPSQVAAQVEAEGERKLARERAAQLLDTFLTEEQRLQLRASNYFELDVLSREGATRTYRIERKWAGSVHEINRETGRIKRTLCIHPRVATPVEDSMLAQKLMLESGMEEDVLRIANHSVPRY